jgi:lipid-A-disaccharide synthase
MMTDLHTTLPVTEAAVPAPKVFLIACEPSGDALGARLMAALREQSHGNIAFDGIGGDLMAGEGLHSRVNISELSVMGIFEVLPRAPLILRRVRQTVDTIEKDPPDIIVTIDSWGFTGRVAKKLRKDGVRVPIVRYVAPQVWAWRPGRAKKLAGWIDHLMTLLPHEPAFFDKVGLNATHVGHPVMESGADQGNGHEFRLKHGLENRPILCVLPGSRRTEVGRLLPVFEETLAVLREKIPNLCVVVPTVSTVSATVKDAVKLWPLDVTVVEGQDEKFNAFAAADVGLAASGTVGLELALAGLPHVITYKVNSFSAWLFRKLTKIRFVNLINLTLDKEAVPELLQEKCNPEDLANGVLRLYSSESLQEQQRADFKAALAAIGVDGMLPSHRAAQTVLQVLQQKSEK